MFPRPDRILLFTLVLATALGCGMKGDKPVAPSASATSGAPSEPERPNEGEPERAEGDGNVTAAKKPTRPEAPKNGAPVALEFMELVGAGDKRAANFWAFSYSDKAIKQIEMTLHYLDVSGKELKSFPWKLSAPTVVGPKDEAKIEKVGAFLPEETASVRVTVNHVTFKDDTTWPETKPAETKPEAK